MTNKDNKPVKIKIKSNKHDEAICCHSKCGPSFGGGCDIRIDNNSNTTMDGVSMLGSIYSHPQYEKGTNEADKFLAGSFYFLLDEIEVHQKE